MLTKYIYKTHIIYSIDKKRTDVEPVRYNRTDDDGMDG